MTILSTPHSRPLSSQEVPGARASILTRNSVSSPGATSSCVLSNSSDARQEPETQKQGHATTNQKYERNHRGTQRNTDLSLSVLLTGKWLFTWKEFYAQFTGSARILCAGC